MSLTFLCHLLCGDITYFVMSLTFLCHLLCGRVVVGRPPLEDPGFKSRRRTAVDPAHNNTHAVFSARYVTDD